ncbi:hypothetical protein DERP_000259 [Dermatophagoides pteronyssinus]|uniref:Uncharacterized protein n=1 Tax=Dermatophagoides pteronyssinus TaxID=6956 RepID=A0ABQ8IZP8_DERPT|nr:hypothetical protein DERP_000259 [Dermatophagoides pteronyssinus]
MINAKQLRPQEINPSTNIICKRHSAPGCEHFAIKVSKQVTLLVGRMSSSISVNFSRPKGNARTFCMYCSSPMGNWTVAIIELGWSTFCSSTESTNIDPRPLWYRVTHLIS